MTALNPTLQTMWQRQSIRQYRDEAVPAEHLKLILEAARRAPTGSNRQNWRLIVVTESALKKQVAALCMDQAWIGDAGAILVLVKLPDQGDTNGAIVLDHAILAATSLGYGTCWVGAINRAELGALLGLPEGTWCRTSHRWASPPTRRPGGHARPPRSSLWPSAGASR